MSDSLERDESRLHGAPAEGRGTPEEGPAAPGAARGVPEGGKRHTRSEAELEGLLEEGRKAELAGATERAEALYREAEEGARTPAVAARALLRRAHVHRSWGMSAESIRLARQGRALARQAGDGALEAELLNAEGAVHQGKGDFDIADALFRSMLALTEDSRIRGIAFQNLGASAAMRKDFPQAESCFRESSLCFERAGYRRGEAFALNNQGRVLLDQGWVEPSRPVLARAVAAAWEVQDFDLHALATTNLAEALLLSGALEEAEERATQALGYFTSAQNPWRAMECLRIQGDVHARRAEAPQAASCYRRALELATTLEAKVETADLVERLGRVGEADGADSAPRNESQEPS